MPGGGRVSFLIILTPPYLDTIETLGVIKTGFLGTLDDEGALNLYDGKLRLIAVARISP